MRGVQHPYAWARDIKEKIQDYIDKLNRNLGGLNILAVAYMTIDNVEYFLLAYKTVVNIVLSLLGHIRPS